MKRGTIATGALALSLMLAACGGAPGTGNTGGASGTGGTSGTAAPALEATSATGNSSDMTGTSGPATEATSALPGTSGTSAAGTSATTTTGGTNGTSATTTTGGTNGTSATTTGGTNGTSATTTTGGTNGTSATTTTGGTNGTSATTTTGGTSATSAEGAMGALMENPQFSTLMTLLSSTGLDEQLAAAGPVTIFAPTDEAFAALPPGTLSALSQDPTTLMQILRYHVAEGAVTSSDITAGESVPTLEGEDVTLSISGSTIRVNDAAEVVQSDIRAGSSVIHAIDQVLIPASVNLPAARTSP